MWDDLDREFDAWRGAGQTIPFWWRDDDAVAHTPALDQLVAVSKAVGVPVHMAVIPAHLEPSLAPFMAQHDALIPVAHGFAHLNHAALGQKKCEFPAGRNVTAVTEELREGFATLSNAFGDRFCPLFVPPWNRFDQGFIPELQAVGYTGFSTFTPRPSQWVADGVTQVNTHVDPIDWHGSRSLVDPAAILAHTVRTLQDRRFDKTDASEPLGFLTHHLVHDPAIWDFTTAFLQRFAAGPIALWTAGNLKD